MSDTNEFYESGRITGFTLTGRISEKEVPEEGNLKLHISGPRRGIDLECFIYGQEASDLYRGTLKNNDNIKLQFTLLADIEGMQKTTRRVKRLTLDPTCKENPARGNIDYLANGEILKIEDHPNPGMARNHVRIILDCGIYIYATAAKTLQLKVGDYISLEGRLDAHIVGKVN